MSEHEEKKLFREMGIQKSIAYTAGLIQGDVTVKTLLESLAEGVVIINEEGRIILINNRLSEMTGYAKIDVMAEPLSIFMESEHHHNHQGHLKKFFSSPRVRPMGIGLELQMKKKDGSTFPVEISISHLTSETGRLGLAFITDITTRKIVEDELLKRNKELDSYAHTVAHDLNSSLLGIVGLSDILADPENGIPKEQRAEYLQVIAERGKKMVNTIKELLLFASMKKGEIELRRVDMNLVVDSALKRLKFDIEKHKAKVTFEKDLSPCLSYSPWLEEVLYNFISNAIKYGGNPPEIKIWSIINDDETVEYCVGDNGNGVDPSFLAEIFEEKNNEKEKKAKGYGLGLSIVKRIADKLEGNLKVDSNPNQGAVFSITQKIID
ncbi:MAG: PAS domain S-box protein [Bacteroidia bacterium]